MANKIISEADLGGTPLTPEQLAQIPDFADIRPQVWGKFPGAVARKTFRGGDLLVEEGDHGTTAFYILSGEVEIFLKTPIRGVRSKRRAKKGFLHSLKKLTSFAPSQPDSGEERPQRTHIPVDGSVDLPIDNPVATLGAGELFGEMTALAFHQRERVKRATFSPRSATVQAKTDVEVLEMLPHILNNVLYTSKKFKQKLADVYRTRSIDHHLRSVPIFHDVSQEFIEFLRDRVELVGFQPGEEICHQGDIADAFF